jgi:hypothetical protein
MTICVKCHRPLKHPTPTGMGRVCASRAAPPVSVHERDLFGYDVDKAADAALYRVRVLVDGMVAEAHVAVRREFAAARRRLGVQA